MSTVVFNLGCIVNMVYIHAFGSYVVCFLLIMSEVEFLIPKQ